MTAGNEAISDDDVSAKPSSRFGALVVTCLD